MKHLSAALISLSPAALWLPSVVYKEEMQLRVNLSHGLQGQTPPSTPCCLHPVPGPTVPQIVPSVMLTAQVTDFLFMVNNLCDLFSFCILTLESLHSYQIQLRSRSLWFSRLLVRLLSFFFNQKWRNMLFCMSSSSSPLCLCTLIFFFLFPSYYSHLPVSSPGKYSEYKTSWPPEPIGQNKLWKTNRNSSQLPRPPPGLTNQKQASPSPWSSGGPRLGRNWGGGGINQESRFGPGNVYRERIYYRFVHFQHI